MPAFKGAQKSPSQVRQVPEENTFKIQGCSICSFSFTNLRSAGKAITKYRTPSSFCLFLTWDYPLKKKRTITNCQLLQTQTTERQIVPGPHKGEGDLFFPPLNGSHTAWVVLAPRSFSAKCYH